MTTRGTNRYHDIKDHGTPDSILRIPYSTHSIHLHTHSTYWSLRSFHSFKHSDHADQRACAPCYPCTKGFSAVDRVKLSLLCGHLCLIDIIKLGFLCGYLCLIDQTSRRPKLDGITVLMTAWSDGRQSIHLQHTLSLYMMQASSKSFHLQLSARPSYGC